LGGEEGQEEVDRQSLFQWSSILEVQHNQSQRNHICGIANDVYANEMKRRNLFSCPIHEEYVCVLATQVSSHKEVQELTEKEKPIQTFDYISISLTIFPHLRVRPC
jgi:hypothetical protein